MKLNKNLQLGLLFALYLARSGRTTIHYAASGLGVSEPFLAQVARLLRKGGVIVSSKGPNGGYELKGEPLVSDVFKAIAPVKLLSTYRLPGSSHEYRALHAFAGNLTASMAPLMNRKIKNLVNEVYANDTAKFNRTSPSTSIN